MKRSLFILILFLTVFGYAQNQQELFQKANTAYQNGQYQEAIDAYTQIAASGVTDADLYYNLANAYYKLNRIAPSIYYYEKALLVNPNHHDAKHNLMYAQRMTVDTFDKLPKSIFQRINESFIYPLHTNTWAIISVVLAFLFALFALLYYFSGQTTQKRFFFVLSTITLFFFLLSLSFTIKRKYYSEHNQPAIVYEAKVSVKSEPTPTADEAFELHEGTKVQIMESLDSWYKIQLPDGNIGWLQQNTVKKLK